MLIITNTNIASTRLTGYTEAVDKIEDKASVYIEVKKEAYTKKTNVIEETKEQDFSRRDTTSAIS